MRYKFRVGFKIKTIHLQMEFKAASQEYQYIEIL